MVDYDKTLDNNELVLVDSLSAKISKALVEKLSLDDNVSKNAKKILSDEVSIVPGKDTEFGLSVYCTGPQNNASDALDLLVEKINTIANDVELVYLDLEFLTGHRVTGVLIYGESSA